MTNFERWKDEILRMSKESKILAFRNNYPDKPVECSDIDSCKDCQFDPGKEYRHCINRMFIWLYDEYIEPIILTRKQRKFLEFLEIGWIVRYESGKLGWYAEKPMWDGFVWVNKPFAPILVIDTQIVDFPFVESENKEPFSVEKMLTLEVEE